MTRECLAAIPDTSISGRRVARELTSLIERRGKPGLIVSDNGAEFTSNAMLSWAQDHRIEWHFIAPEKPMQNGFRENFSGRRWMRVQWPVNPHDLTQSHDFAIKIPRHHNTLQSDTLKEVFRMISKATMKQGKSLCQKQGISASIKLKCMSYVGINESRLGAFATQMGAAKLFLMWLRSELDHPMDEDG